MSSILLSLEDDPGVWASWRFLRRRLIRIFPIYWVFAFMELARLTRSYGYLETNYLPSLLLLPGLYPKFPMLIGVAWTMVFEMFFYYTLAALLLVTVRRAVPVSIAFFCLAVLVGEVVHPQNSLLMTLSNPILLEFVSGAIIALAFQYFAKRRRLGIAMLVLGVAVSLYIQSHQGLVGAQGLVMVMSSQGVIRRVLTWGIAAMLLVAGVVFWSPSSNSLLSGITVALGDSSYSAYLASSLLIEFTWRILRKSAGHATPTLSLEVLFQCLITGIVLLVGWVSYKFVERPMLRSLQQKQRRTQRSPASNQPRLSGT